MTLAARDGNLGGHADPHRARSSAWWSTGIGETAAVFAIYFVLDRLTRRAAQLSSDPAGAPVLLVRAVIDNPLAWLALVVLVGALLSARPWSENRLWAPWRAVEQGGTLRLIALAPVLQLAWLSSCYHYNFVAGQWHVADRVAAIGLAAAAVFRPMFLVPFVIEVRVIARQFAWPLGTEAGQNIDAILVTALVAVSALYVFHVLTGCRRSAPVLIVLSTIFASHFFVPGRARWRLAGSQPTVPGTFP